MSRKGTIIIFCLLIVALVLTFVIRYERNVPAVEVELGQPAEAQHVPKILYGINADSLDVFRGKVKKNEFLADILLKHHIDYPTIDRLAHDTKTVFDVRKIRYGNDYIVMKTRDSLAETRYFVYEISPIDYVVYGFDDSISVVKGSKEITADIDTASGIIESSLWNAMVDQDADPNLANELSEIYAWTIDFFGIQQGDAYKVVYETLYADGEKIGIGKVLAANFIHLNTPHYAFYFVQDSTGDYFDDVANSLRRTFLKAPLRYKRISSKFSYSRMHPILKYRRPHLGVDYAAARGTPVMAVGDGVVTRASWDKGGGGRVVKIKHNGTYTTLYMHLSKYGKGIKAGVSVKQGQVIGYVGASGLATGPHLDFRFYRNGKAVDPLKVKSPAAKPVDSAYHARFLDEKNRWLKILDSIVIDKADLDSLALTH